MRGKAKQAGLVAATFLLALLQAGCVTLPLQSPLGHERENPAPSQMVVTASPSCLGAGGKDAHTGIFCRIYFFSPDDPRPKEVSGDVTIVAYDEERGSKESPEGLYKIPGGELPKHLRHDVVGDSYLFWLPFGVREPRRVVLTAALESGPDKTLESSSVKMTLEPPEAAAPAAPDATQSKPKHKP